MGYAWKKACSRYGMAVSSITIVIVYTQVPTGACVFKDQVIFETKPQEHVSNWGLANIGLTT